LGASLNIHVTACLFWKSCQAILDLGIRCIIATSFADIFQNNCMKNGILPIVVTPPELEACMADALAELPLQVAAPAIGG
jgi:3-isopropylmalate dehydratase small subunit